MRGLRFTETMRGFCSTTVTNDYAAAFDAGQRDGSPLEFTLTITVADLDAFLKSPAHEGRISGQVTAPALSSTPFTVTDGTFRLMVDDPMHVHSKRMDYILTLTGGPVPLLFEGFKEIHDDPGADIWADTSTLFVTISTADRSKVLAKGVQHIMPADFAKQMTTLQITGAANPIDALAGMAQFGLFFAGALFDIYGTAFARATELNPNPTPRARRPLKMSAPEVHSVTTGDGVGIRLTRYQGGRKGPVLLAPGYGTSTLAFTIDTVDTNLPEALFAAGYDTWLFDYRASPELPSSHTQFTLDDVAVYDYPAAVAEVLKATGAPSVQVMAHCVGSLTFLMAMMAGMQHVRSAICSALTLYPVSPLINQVKAGLDLGSVLKQAGVTTLTTDFNPNSITDQMLDAFLKLFPGTDACGSAVCRRIQGIYGDVYKHAQLNDATHTALHEMFGVANLTAFNHLTTMLRKGFVVDHLGNDTYMPHVDRLSIPIVFLHGAENHLFLPEGSDETLKLLSYKNDAKFYERIVFPNYAHMDCFIGRNASADVFPDIVAALDRFN
jgi:cholesterol oxidase